MLAAILTAFGAQGVSFLKIESRPTREAMGSYLIFLDCPGAATDEPIRRGIAAVEAGDLAAVRILGSFPVG